MEFFGHIIDGEESGPAGPIADSVDPWTRSAWARFPVGGHEQAGRAVAAARRAFDEGPWPRMGFAERGEILHRLAGLVESRAAELGMADTRDMGKPVAQSAGNDVPRAARNLRFFADHARMATSQALPMDSGHHCYTRFEPAGVVAAIAPWNFPLMLGTWKIAPALAWGNTVVLKPAESTPASATMLARLALEAGMPPGVLNVVHGYGPASAGEALTRDPRVDRITFTGESATGKAISTAAAANLTPVSLELGGKGASIVFADADLDNAVRWSIKAIFTNAGQVCLAGSRLLVQRPVYDEFMARFVEAAEAMVLGDPARQDTEIGPLASIEHHHKVCGYLDRIAAEGGKIRTGGAGDGWFVRPTVVQDAPFDSGVWRDEIFGPVVAVAPFDTEAEAVGIANGTRYGLNGMLFTTDLNRAHRVSAKMRAGTVWVNCFFVRDLRAPFGGAGDSGVGREGGDFSRDFFTEPKAVVLQLDH
ncbi:5-carboxymethyl-2-hydroxymuconate semialdehyde dehydrogenase [Kibdelosporangium aridum]|uniref:5-carboxymethyl-2-hydroxymuconate semialdehyde dehydrogenase n=1 Tax=Kibdelosporangium aridum TaxID=2030 RepID=A0A428Z0P9_KIBAR|nr:aldehyde dehydrogenase [Kibdelosporangium aridum]RSM77790.1 5-carboxymethyl-2-hydroxymuconate semialdehyde dehydrogenase [Kibdelosporangium aridum]